MFHTPGAPLLWSAHLRRRVEGPRIPASEDRALEVPLERALNSELAVASSPDDSREFRIKANSRHRTRGSSILPSTSIHHHSVVAPAGPRTSAWVVVPFSQAEPHSNESNALQLWYNARQRGWRFSIMGRVISLSFAASLLLLGPDCGSKQKTAAERPSRNPTPMVVPHKPAVREPGARGGPCLASGRCDEGLTCLRGKCLLADDSAEDPIHGL